MRCVDENLAIDFLAGDLTEEARVQVEAHMDECPACLVNLVTFARTQAASVDAPPKAGGAPLRGIADVDAPPKAGGAPLRGIADVDDPPELASGTSRARVPTNARAVLRRGAVVGRYVVLDLVGVGAMGSVYSAADPMLRRTVALKLVRARVGEDRAASTERLVREARVLAQIVHPNVVAVHDVGTYESEVFLAMDFVEGQTLREWLAAAPRSTREIVRVFIEAGRGLVAAHAAGVVHRDFKPENVLVGNDGRVLVGDFGLAGDHRLDCGPSDCRTRLRRLLDRPDESRDLPPAVVGTPAYMAPEQLLGVAGESADQYSFCVSLHEALFGVRPRSSSPPPPSPPVRREAEVGSSSPPWSIETAAPARGRRHVAGRVRRTIARGLSDLPARRHPSMAALLGALTHDPWKPWRRYGLVAGLAVLAVAFFGARAHQAKQAVATCRSAGGRLAEVWASPQKEAMHAAFLATGKPYAEDAWGNVERAVDDYTRDWAAGSADACMASRVRHEQSAAMLELRSACYSERFEELRAILEVLASSDGLWPSVDMGDPAQRGAAGLRPSVDIVKNASTMVREFAPLSQCSSEHALHVVSPPDASKAKAVARVRGALAKGRALRNAGRMKDGLAAVTRAADESAALGYQPLEAFALFELGLAQSRSGDKVTADATMAHAARVADSARDDATRVRALSQRLFIHGNAWKKAEGLAELDAEASSALARIGGDDPRAEEAYRYNVGMAFFGLRDFDRAVANIERAEKLSEQVYGAKSYDLARDLSGLCVVLGVRGDLDHAIPYCERSAATFRDAFGPKHPDYALAVQNLGAMLLDTDQTEAACARIEEGYRIGLAALGPEHAQVVAAESNLGECMNERREFARAIELLEQALSLRERIPGATPIDLAHTQSKLARAYVGANLPERAVPIAERALLARDAGIAGPGDRSAIRFVLARALWNANANANTTRGRDRARAKQLANEALRLCDEDDRAKGKPSPDRQEIATWLAQHP